LSELTDRRRFIGYAAAVLYVLSFIFPWFTIRANRMALAESVSLYRLGPVWIAVLLSTAVAVSGQMSLNHTRIQSASIIASALMSAVIPFGLIHQVYSVYAESILPAGRIGVSAGWYLFIGGGILQLIPKKRPRYSLAAAGTVAAASVLFLYYAGSLEMVGIVREAMTQSRRIPGELLQHIRIVFTSVFISTIAGIPAAIAAYRNRKVRTVLFSVFNVLQTIPAIALFGLMIAPLAFLGRSFPVLREAGLRGIGNTPAIIALAVYGLYPVMRNSFTALSRPDGGVIDAARGMGMSIMQEWRMVRIPLAAPIMLNGIRIAAIQTTGNAVLAKLIGGSGLGVFVFEGLGQASADLVLLGMGITVILTLVLDMLLNAGIRAATPKPLRFAETASNL
jgi:osmoprotectant transport system permease protein